MAGSAPVLHTGNMTRIPDDYLGFYTPMKRAVPRKVEDQRLAYDNLYNNHYPDKEMTPRIKKVLSRHNMPQPTQIRCHTDHLMSVFCYTKTKNVMDENSMKSSWWPSEDQHLKTPTIAKPPYDMRTTYRWGFQDPPTESLTATRYGCAPEQVAAIGIAPLISHTQLSESRLPKVWEESIIFQSTYDLRTLDNKPTRGMRHGSFMWNEIKPPKPPQSGGRVFACSPEAPPLKKGDKLNGIAHNTSMTQLPKLVC